MEDNFTYEIVSRRYYLIVFNMKAVKIFIFFHIVDFLESTKIFQKHKIKKKLHKLMAIMPGAVKIALLILALFLVKTPCFLNSNSVCYYRNNSNDILFEESHIYSARWQFKQESGLFVSYRYALKMLAILNFVQVLLVK